ncbi:SPASM domain-containing protein, partial [Candidatus Bathyarchaeota archaeon]
LDGPAEMHDRFRVTKDGGPTHGIVMWGLRLLQGHGVPTDILCVVNSHNVGSPLEVYRFLRENGATYISFLPMVEPDPEAEGGVNPMSVPPGAWGEFLCAVFDDWRDHDIGRVRVQIFEEATRTAFGQEHSLCIFRPTCGDIPVVEHNGDFYSCDHYVDEGHRLGNITETPLVELLESPEQRAFGEAKLETLPRYCRDCEVLEMCNGECLKNRFAVTPDGEPRLNYLCEGYRRFFNHCRPFVDEVAALWRRQNP